MASSSKAEKILAAAIAGIPRVAEAVALIPEEDRPRALDAVEGSYRQTVRDLGYEEGPVQSWVSAVMFRLRSEVKKQSRRNRKCQKHCMRKLNRPKPSRTATSDMDEERRGALKGESSPADASMASDFEEPEVLEAAVAGIPAIAEFIAAMPNGQRAIALAALERHYLETAEDWGCSEGPARMWVSAMMSSSPGANRTDDRAGNNRLGRRPTQRRLRSCRENSYQNNGRIGAIGAFSFDCFCVGWLKVGAAWPCHKHGNDWAGKR